MNNNPDHVKDGRLTNKTSEYLLVNVAISGKSTANICATEDKNQ